MLILMLAVLAGGICAIIWGVQQLMEPTKQTLPNIIGTHPESSVTASPSEDGEDSGALESTADYTVVIDPGHGGGDGGTVGHIIEKEMTEVVAQLLYDMLTEDGRFDVVLTRSLEMDDEEYMGQYERVEVATAADPDLFLSIHGNAFDGEEVRGTECFPIPYGRDYHEESLAFAQLIAAGFAAEGAVLRGDTGVRYAYFEGTTLYYEEEGYEEANDDYTYAVLQDVTYPAVLVEAFYVSSTADLEIFGGEEGYQMSAEVYYHAICDYFYADDT